MKRIISYTLVIVLAMAASLSSFAATEADSTKVELTKEQIYSDVKTTISAIADALKVGSEHVYTVLVKQQVVNSITYLVVVLVLFAIPIVLFKFASSEFVKANDGDIPCAIFGGISIILALVVTAFVIGPIVTGFVNPEYGAIQDILSFFKKGC